MSWSQAAFQRSVVRRSLKIAAIVGCILIIINHSDALLRGDFSGGRIFRMGLTFVVPYVVSTVSSVGALREQERRKKSEPPSSSS